MEERVRFVMVERDKIQMERDSTYLERDKVVA